MGVMRKNQVDDNDTTARLAPPGTSTLVLLRPWLRPSSFESSAPQDPLCLTRPADEQFEHQDVPVFSAMSASFPSQELQPSYHEALSNKLLWRFFPTISASCVFFFLFFFFLFRRLSCCFFRRRFLRFVVRCVRTNGVTSSVAPFAELGSSWVDRGRRNSNVTTSSPRGTSSSTSSKR